MSKDEDIRIVAVTEREMDAIRLVALKVMIVKFVGAVLERNSEEVSKGFEVLKETALAIVLTEKHIQAQQEAEALLTKVMEKQS